MTEKSFDNYTVDELKELRRVINRKIRDSNRGFQTETKTATLRRICEGTYLHRYEWQVVLEETKLGYCTEIGRSQRKVVIRAETKEQAILGIDSLICELAELKRLVNMEGET